MGKQSFPSYTIQRTPFFFDSRDTVLAYQEGLYLLHLMDSQPDQQLVSQILPYVQKKWMKCVSHREEHVSGIVWMQRYCPGNVPQHQFW
jgi:hypothetical protein